MRRRGLTFIEVVVSIAMLATFATLVLGSISVLESNALRNKHRLQASELAHRVIVQYLDDQDSIPSPDQPVEQGDTRYRVETEETILLQETAEIEGLSESTAVSNDEVDIQDRVQSMHRLAVRVYMWEPRNEIEANTPIAELVRHYYPFLQDEDWAREWLLNILSERTGQ